MSHTNNLNYPEGADSSPRHIPHKEGYTINDYRKIAVIGEGSFGQVWKAERDGFFVALKILNKSLNSKETQDELRSLETLNKLQHRSILQTKNFWSDGERLYIEMELADGGSLKDRLKAYRSAGEYGIPKEVLLKYFLDTAQALDYLHHQTPVMLHRDIKPGNILLVNECAKIADFGLLRQVSGDKSATRTQGGTVLYLAPESISGDVASVHTDLFSFAVTYVELRQGALPFSGKSVGQIYDKIRWERPELNDVLHPEEKKVLLKALEKEPHKRFASCFEFIHQLQRMVPWEPAFSLAPVRASAQTTPSLERTPMHHTTPPQPGQAPGATAHRTPIPTHPAVELPAEDGVGPSELTPARDDGTTKEHPVVKGTSKHPPKDHRATVPAPPPAIEATPSKRDTAPRRTAVPIPKPARRKAPRRFVAAAVLLTLVSAIAGGIWFVAHTDVKGRIHEHIKNKEFARALKIVDETSSLVLPDAADWRAGIEAAWWLDLEPSENADTESLRRALLPADLAEFENAFRGHAGPAKLRRRLETRWWSELAESERKGPESFKEIADYLGSLTKSLNQLNAFLASFPKHREAEARRQAVQSDLFNSVSNWLDKNLLAANKISKIEDASRFVEKYLALVGDHEKEKLNDKLQNKRTARAALDKAQGLFKSGEWGDCLAAINETKAVFDTIDVAEKNNLVSAARAKRDKSKDQDVTSIALKNAHAKAWSALHAEQISIPDCERYIRDFDKIPGLDPAAHHLEYKILQALLQAHQSPPGKWDASPLSSLIREARQRPELLQNLWVGLVRLETDFFSFQNMECLQDALPAPPSPEVRSANSQILVPFFVRHIEKDQFKWLPNDAEMKKCLDWLGRIDPPKIDSIDCIRALKVECEIALGKPTKFGAALRNADWYGKYVEALTQDREGKDATRAADILSEGLQGKAEFVRKRTDKAVALLRKAVDAALKPNGKDAAKAEDAQKAIAWILLVLELQKQLRIDDEIKLISAAVQAGKSDILKNVDARLEKGKYSPTDKQKGYHTLAKASRELKEHDPEVVAYFVKALDQPSGQDELRKGIAGDAAVFSRQLVKTADDYMLLKAPDWTEAIKNSKLCREFVLKWKDIDLETAAKLNHDAVYIQANATGHMESNDFAGQRAAAYRVFRSATKNKSLDDGFLVPVVLKRFEFTSEDDAKELREQLEESIPEGKAATAVARKLADSRKQQGFWKTQLCLGLVALGQAKQDGLEIKKADRKTHKAETEDARKSYQEAREIGSYPEKWRLDYLIGDTYYLTCDNPIIMDAEVKRAIDELTTAQKALQAIQPPARVHTTYLARISKRLKELKELQSSK